MCLKVLIFGGILCTASASSPCANPQVLSEGQKVSKTAKSASQLEVYLHKALREQVSATFTDVFLSISLRDANDFRVYQAHNCSGVLDEHEQDNRYFGLLKSVNSWRAHHLPPFNDTYVGITASKAYSVGISVWHVNYIRVALFLGGILLFLFAGALVRNVVFYYTSGCSIGLLASVLVVAIIVYRIAPKKTIGIPILLGGWSFAAYMLHFAWDNCASILQQYQEYVIGYFTLAFLISFAICYKRGPPTDERSHDIAQWTLQLIALLLVYFSTQIPKVSYATIAILILHQATQSWLWRLLSSVWNFLAWIWLKLFPRKRKLLSQEEYDKEARETTRKELAKLRAYCRSPEANAWKITHSVRNPKRLARFIDGTEDHISDEEYVEHDLEGDRLDPDTDLFTEEDDYEHEIIIRRRSRHGLASPLDPAERSILIPRGVSSQELLDRISASTVPERRAPKVARRTRHSLGGGGHAAHIPPPPPRQPLARESRVPPRRTAPKPKKATSSRSTMSFRSHEYFSSDSEDQATYEEELLARGDEFDFERD